MSLSAFKLKKLTAAIGTCLVLGASGPMLADTDLIVENDSLGLTAFVGSGSQEVLSTSIRIVGPEGFVFEDRIEGTLIDWLPPEGLPDGLYTWEAWTVSANPQSELRDPISASQREELPQEALEARYEKIPIERFYSADDLNVTTESGHFKVRDGWLETLEETLGDEFSQTTRKFGIGRIAGALLNFVIPSAHAQDLTASGANPRVIWNRDDDTLDYEAGGTNLRWRLQHPGRVSGLHYALSVYTSAPNHTLTLRGTSPGNTGRPRVGIGTITASEALHIRSTASANIRLDNPSVNQSWFIKNQNAGKFEIGEVTNELGAFVIAPDSPMSSLHIRPNQDCVANPFGGEFCGSVESRIGVNTSEPLANLHIVAGSSGGLLLPDRAAAIRLEGSAGGATRIFGSESGFSIGTTQGGSANIFQVDGGAPSGSLIIGSNGNVGIGTGTPSQNLQITSSARTAILIDSGPNEQADFTFREDGIARWAFRMRGGNQNFEIARRAADGSALDTPITIANNDGRTILRNGLQLVSQTPPSNPFSGATLFVNESSGDLQVRFANGTTRTIATN